MKEAQASMERGQVSQCTRGSGGGSDAVMGTVGRCEYFLDKKQRQCGMMCKKGASVCTEHARPEGLKGRRVPCPLDPKHTVWEASLRKHLLKCNKLKLRHVNDGEAYYSADVNCARRCVGVRLRQAAAPPGTGDGSSCELNEAILSSIPIIEKAWEAEFDGELPLDVRTNEFMLNGRYNQLISNKKHAIQQSSLIQHCVDRELTRQASFIEFGCGRAELSRYFNQVVTNGAPKEARQHFILVDRASNRMKFDKKLRDDYQELAGEAPPELTYRYKIDIKDLKLDAVLRDSEYVAISKHLCGVATDLTLRCITNSETLMNKGRLKGLCIAMCCRHVCDPEEYVNPEYVNAFLKDENIDYNTFFRALQKICSWATCGRRPGVEDDDVNNHFTSMTVKQRENLGFMARRIIDHGRYLWIKSHLSDKYTVELIRYATKDVSLEDVAMLIY